MEPINYQLPQQNPINDLMQGLQAGAAIRQIREQAQAREDANALKESFKTDFASYQAAPSSDKIINMQFKYPQMTEALKPLVAHLNEKQLDSDASTTMQVLNSIKSGKPELATSIIDNHIKALENSGLDTTKLQNIKAGIESDPTNAASMIEFQLANIIGPEKYAKYVEAQGKSQEADQKAKLFPDVKAQAVIKTQTDAYKAVTAGAEALNAPEKYASDASKSTSDAIKSKVEAKFAPFVEQGKLNLNRAQISNISSQITDRAKRFNLDAQKISIEVSEKLQKLQNKTSNLSPASLKLVNEAAVNSASSKQSSSEMEGLAEKLDSIQGWGKYAGGATEFLKAATGQQDPTTMIKKEYVRLRNNIAIKSLPPGPATDRDIELALRGMPDEHANPKELSQFMRGMAKMQKIASKVEDAKADWITETGGSLGRSSRDFVAGGYKVKHGQSFGDFSQSIAVAVSKKDFKEMASGTRDITPTAPVIPAGKTKNLINLVDKITGYKQ